MLRENDSNHGEQLAVIGSVVKLYVAFATAV